MSEQGKTDLTVEEAKRLIIEEAIKTENLIRVRHAGPASSVHVGGKTFVGIESYVATDAVDELVKASEADQVPFNGEKVNAFRIRQTVIDRFTRDTGG